MPSYVNFSTLGLDSQVLDLPHGVTKLLKEAELITIGDIVACAKSQLVEENGFSLRQIANLEGSLEEYGCYLQEWEPFSKREGIVDEDIIVSEDDSDPDF
jgi:hypothetical protein